MEAAAMLGVSRSLIYTMIHSDGFPKIQIGRKIIIPIDALRAYLTKKSGAVS